MSARKKSSLATEEDFLKATFQPDPFDWGAAIGTRAEFIQHAGDEYPTVFLALAALKRDDIEITDMVREVGLEGSIEFYEFVNRAAKSHKAIGEALETASVRLLVGLHRAAHKDKGP